MALPPRCWHCKSLDVHWPDAHCRLLPQFEPSDTCLSVGQAEELPVQDSAMSQLEIAGLHTYDEGRS
jgi:hypothetical protein